MSDSVGQYLNEIGMVPLLNAQEERELSQIIEAGAAARARKEAGETGREIERPIRAAARAKDRFIRSNLRLVVSVARRYPCLLYTSPSPRDKRQSRMPSSA